MEHGYRIAIVDEDGEFPDPSASPGDLPIAAGWALTPELMLKAYARGIFAWTGDPVTGWSPDPRAVFELDGFHVSRSLARKVRQGRFRVTVDRAFPDVVRGCAGPRADGGGTWVSDWFSDCFAELFRSGYAHSVEAWDGDRLAGGVFGVSIGG